MASVSTSRELLLANTWSTLGNKTWGDADVAETPWISMTRYALYVEAQESLMLVEQVEKLFAAALASALSVDSGASKDVIAALAEEVLLADSEEKTARQDLQESLIVESLISKDGTHEVEDGFAVDSCASKAPGVNAITSLGLDDGGEIVRDMAITRSEALKVAELLSNQSSVALTDSFGMTDANAKKIMPNILQSLNLAENTIKHVRANWETIVGIAELCSKRATIYKATAFDFVESTTKAIGQNVQESLIVEDVFDRVVEFFRTFEESVAVKDEILKTVGKFEYRDLNIAQAMILPAMMVIGDMLASTLREDQSFTAENFIQSLDIGAVPGWTQWRNFVPGDYEYSQAMFRVAMRSISADRAQLEQCKVAVDVPDVIDRGAAIVETPEEGVYVEFEREYHIIPEITLTARGGRINPTAAELLGSPSLLGFTARLRDTVTGEYVAGTFTWASHGY